MCVNSDTFMYIYLYYIHMYKYYLYYKGKLFIYSKFLPLNTYGHIVILRKWRIRRASLLLDKCLLISNVVWSKTQSLET